MRDYFDKSISGGKRIKQQVHCSNLVINANNSRYVNTLKRDKESYLDKLFSESPQAFQFTQFAQNF